MPLPILAVGAVALGLWGAKKGYDAYEDNSIAESNNKEAQKIYDEPQSELNVERKNTNVKLEELGALKVRYIIEVCKTSLI